MTKQYFAGLEINYYKQFVKEGDLDTVALLAMGLNEAQIENLRAEAESRGWFEGEVVSYDTGPLEMVEDEPNGF